MNELPTAHAAHTIYIFDIRIVAVAKPILLGGSIFFEHQFLHFFYKDTGEE